MRSAGKKIGTILLESGFITVEQLQEALDDQVGSFKVLGEILVEKGLLEDRQITKALGMQFSLPVVDIDVDRYRADPSVLRMLPRNLMERYRAFPLELLDEGRSLLVAVSDPLDLAIRERLCTATPLDIKLALAPERDILSALRATAEKAGPRRTEFPTAAGGDAESSRIWEPISETAAVVRTEKEGQFDETFLPDMPPTFPEEPSDEIPEPAETLQTGIPQVIDPDEALPLRRDLSKAHRKIGEVLLQLRAVDGKQLTDALQKQAGLGKRLGEILVNEGIITEMKLAEALSTQLKLPLFALTRYKPLPEAIKSVPRHVSERLRLVPLTIVESDLLLVAMADPLDLLAQDEVRMLTGRDLKLCVTTSAEIENNLDRLYNLQDNLADAIVEIRDLEAPRELFTEVGINDAPVIQLVSNVLNQAVREGASDIHVEPCKNNGRIRYRVDGVLYGAFEYPSALHPAISARMKIMAGIDIAEKRKPQDGRILIKTAGRHIDLRVSSLPTTRGEKVVLRILDQDSSAVGLDRLGFEPDDMEKINAFCESPWGIVLATGPTGSGKSTTLYSILEKINQPGVNIVTVEDPVEYSLDGISQVHVNEKAGLTFESALRSILRQDPDKIMVGEIRDQKTAQIAIRAALTGHFVLSTLHTNDAPSALTRMIDMGVPPFLVSASLSGVIAQRLVRRLCPFCKEEYEIDPNVCEALSIPRGSRAWKAVECNECRQGYRGRKGIYEIMMIDDDSRKMILEGASSLELRSEAIRKGMKTLRQSGINNVLAGLTTIEEVFATTL